MNYGINKNIPINPINPINPIIPRIPITPILPINLAVHSSTAVFAKRLLKIKKKKAPRLRGLPEEDEVESPGGVLLKEL